MKTTEWPQVGDKYYAIHNNGVICEHHWDEKQSKNGKPVFNCFKTMPEAITFLNNSLKMDGKIGFNFELAEVTAVKSELTNCLISTEDYFEYLPNGKKKEYFTWDEAMALDLPEGWRLPTRKEWMLICEEFANDDKGELDSDLLCEKIKLKKNGCVYEVDDYLTSGTGLNYLGSYGYYWSSTASSGTDAYDLSFDGSGIYPQNTLTKTYGFSVRLVKEV